ncbi:hypothetical protein J3F83DRAFT_455747 [Trichoderma novae-zelandiae]
MRASRASMRLSRHRQREERKTRLRLPREPPSLLIAPHDSHARNSYRSDPALISSLIARTGPFSRWRCNHQGLVWGPLLRSHRPGPSSVLIVMVDKQRQMAEGYFPSPHPHAPFAITGHPGRPTRRPATCCGLPRHQRSTAHHERERHGARPRQRGRGCHIGATKHQADPSSASSFPLRPCMDHFIRLQDQCSHDGGQTNILPASFRRASPPLCLAWHPGHTGPAG